MGEGTAERIFDKLDDLKEDTQEIKQSVEVMKANDFHRDQKIKILEENMEYFEDRLEGLEHKAYFVKGYWKAILVVSGLLAFALNYFKEVWFR